MIYNNYASSKPNTSEDNYRKKQSEIQITQNQNSL
jgi:hypothetical protein